MHLTRKTLFRSLFRFLSPTSLPTQIARWIYVKERGGVAQQAKFFLRERTTKGDVLCIFFQIIGGVNIIHRPSDIFIAHCAITLEKSYIQNTSESGKLIFAFINSLSVIGSTGAY